MKRYDTRGLKFGMISKGFFPDTLYIPPFIAHESYTSTNYKLCIYLKFIHAEEKESDPIDLNEIWMTNHCRTSQYFLQIVKCDDITCCYAMGTN